MIKYSLPLSLAVLALGTLPAHATTYMWTGGGGANTNWSNGSNWQGGVAPPTAVPSNDTTDIDFMSSGSGVSTVDTSYVVSSVSQFGIAYNINGASSSTTLISPNFNNSSSSALTINATVDNSSNQVTFNSGTYRVSTNGFSGYSNVNINSGVTVYSNTSNSGSVGGVGGAYGSVYVNGTIAGTGAFFGKNNGGSDGGITITGGAAISPGDPTINGGIGALTLRANSLTVYGGGILNFVLGAGGTNSSIVATNGRIDLPAGNLTFNITGTATAGTTYNLISYLAFADGGASNVTFSGDAVNLPAGYTLGQNAFLTTADTGTTGVYNGNNIEIYDVQLALVPEPSTWVTLVSGAVCVFAVCRRIRKNA